MGSEVEAIRGVCEDLCPTEEASFRRRERLLHPLERDGRPLVKAYSRPAADKPLAEPASLRPFPTLRRCLDYLTGAELNEAGHDWATLYGFVIDRLRALRQDMVVQRISGAEAASLLLPQTPWLFQAHYRCQLRPTSSFDPALHKAQADEVLDRIAEALPSLPAASELRQEVVDLLCLVNAGKPRLHPNSEASSISTAVAAAFRLGNLVRWARLFPFLPESLAHAALAQLPALRLRALRSVAVAYKSKAQRLSLDFFQELLALDDAEQAIDLLSSLNLNSDAENGIPMSSDFSCLASLSASSLPPPFHKAEGLLDQRRLLGL